MYKLPTVWSKQQSAFIDWSVKGHGSCVLEAVAGSGKTTTILGAVTKMDTDGIAILAYNKKIADEITSKLQDLKVDWKKAQAGTVHSFGFRVLKKFLGNVKVDEKKIYNIIDSLDKGYRFASVVNQLVSLAKQRVLKGGGPEAWKDIINHFDLLEDNEVQFTNEIIEMAQRVLAISNETLEVIDFDDMVYLPLILPVRPFRYQVIFVDEAQDTNPARRALVKLLLAPGGRVIAVGDRHQAIYGFTGADSDSLDLIGKEFKAREMPLTITYRCPKAIVEFAHQWVSHIQASEKAPEGKVSVQEPGTQFTPEAHSAVLCRNTKYLVTCAFDLIRRRIPCRIEGRDIAKGLVKLANKWKTAKTMDAFEVRLDVWFDQQKARLIEGPKLAMVADQVETLRAIMGFCREEKKTHMTDVVAWVEELFGDNVVGVVVLSTIHKSKGREWKKVYWLNRSQTLPSPYATQDWMKEQENNLCYVATTRAMEELVEVTI